MPHSPKNKIILFNLTDAPIYVDAVEKALKHDFKIWLNGKPKIGEQFTVKRLIRPAIEHLKSLGLGGDGLGLIVAAFDLDTRTRKGAVSIERDYIEAEIRPLVRHYTKTRKETTKRWSARLVIIVALVLYGQTFAKKPEPEVLCES